MRCSAFGQRATALTGWSWVTIAEKLGGWIFKHSYLRSNRTRRAMIPGSMKIDVMKRRRKYEDENRQTA